MASKWSFAPGSAGSDKAHIELSVKITINGEATSFTGVNETPLNITGDNTDALIASVDELSDQVLNALEKTLDDEAEKVETLKQIVGKLELTVEVQPDDGLLKFMDAYASDKDWPTYKNPGLGYDHRVKTKLFPAVPALLEASARCPFKYCEEHKQAVRLDVVIMHLNDKHMVSREYIADWLDTLDIDLTVHFTDDPEKKED
jgi:hypothetical protein